MLLLLGLKHPKLVGLNWQRQPAIFAPQAYQSFTSPKNSNDKRACASEAFRYYQALAVSKSNEIIGDFGIVPATPGLIEKVISNPKLIITALQLAEDADLSKARKCRYCGKLFIPTSGNQEVCPDNKCQWQRKYDFIKTYRRKKKQEAYYHKKAEFTKT